MSELETDAIVAAASLAAGSGCKAFEIGYLDETAKVEDARWYATATYQGAKIMVEDRKSPDEAADALARRILSGADCNHCHKTVTLGRTHPSQCRWYRDADRWIVGCQDIPAGRLIEDNPDEQETP